LRGKEGECKLLGGGGTSVKAGEGPYNLQERGRVQGRGGPGRGGSRTRLGGRKDVRGTVSGSEKVSGLKTGKSREKKNRPRFWRENAGGGTGRVEPTKNRVKGEIVGWCRRWWEHGGKQRERKGLEGFDLKRTQGTGPGKRPWRRGGGIFHQRKGGKKKGKRARRTKDVTGEGSGLLKRENKVPPWKGGGKRHRQCHVGRIKLSTFWEKEERGEWGEVKEHLTLKLVVKKKGTTPLKQG